MLRTIFGALIFFFFFFLTPIVVVTIIIISELKDIKAQLLPPLSMIESSRRDIWREI